MGGPTGQSHPTVKEHAGGGLFIRLLIPSFHSSPHLSHNIVRGSCHRTLQCSKCYACICAALLPSKRSSRGVSLYPREATRAGEWAGWSPAACCTRKPGLRKCTVHMGALYKNQELHTNLGLTREACIDTRAWNCRQESPQFMGQF